MYGLYIIFCVVGVVWGILNVVLFFKIWSMCNDVKMLTERVLSITQKEQDNINEAIKQKLSETHTIGEWVVYPPAKRVMLVKEITPDGMYKCVEINKNGEEEPAGIYKPSQVVKHENNS